MNATLRISSSDVRKELSIQDDRTESDNRVEVTLLKGIAENNLPHTVRCKSTKPPYAERHVRWCGRSVNVKVGGKCLLWITFTSYPILYENPACPHGLQGYPKNNLTLIITKNLNLCQIQIQYVSPTNLANYRERCKRKGIFIQRIYRKFFQILQTLERIYAKSIFRKVIL